MSNKRKQILSNLIKENELRKFAEEVLEKTPEGELVADQIFNKLLNELDIDSLE